MKTLRQAIYTIYALTLLFSSCMTLNDSWTDLGDNYKFHADGEWASISPSQMYYQTQIYSKVTAYKFDDQYIIAKQTPDREHYLLFTTSDYTSRFIIYSNFLKNSTTKEYIDETTPFVRQAIEADSSLHKLLVTKGVTDQNQINDQEKIRTVVDSVFRNDPFYIRLFSSSDNYWIIEKAKNRRYGPFTKQEFDHECKQQDINLKFN